MIKSRITVLLTVLSALCSVPCHAGLPVLTVLHTFAPGGSGDLSPSDNTNLDGAKPEAPLVQGRDGMLYGTTSDGGTHGTGVIFRVKSNGTGFTILHTFSDLGALFVSESNSDGCRPNGALVFGKDETLYGVTGQGGSEGGGTVFRLHPDGSGFQVLHSFEPLGSFFDNNKGANPVGITIGADQLLYGVTELGGRDGKGLVFRMAQDGKNFQVLHVFSSVTYEDNRNKEGAIPSAAVVIGHDGALYGTTNIGGNQGNGVLYKMDADGKHFAVLHHFRRKGGDYKNNGVFPEGSLTLSQDNFLYGCTRQGGADDGGVVYKISADGTEFTVLHTFSATNSENQDGGLPAGPLVFGPDGRLYGVSGGGGEQGAGTLFKVSADGAKFYVLHDFSLAEGGYTLTGLTLGRDEGLYGVSTNGGNDRSGTIFRVTFPAAK